MAAFVGVVFYATLGVFLATLFRDRAAPLLVAAAIILAQTILSSLPLWSGSELLQWVPRLFPGNAMGALLIATEREVGLIAPEAVLPGYLNGPWPFSLAVCLVWICALVMGSILLLGRSDVTD